MKTYRKWRAKALKNPQVAREYIKLITSENKELRKALKDMIWIYDEMGANGVDTKASEKMYENARAVLWKADGGACREKGG